MSTGRRRGEAAGKCQLATPSKQPPRILVVDIQTSTWAHTCRTLCGALENVLALACSLVGPPRIPLLSLYATWNRRECLLPFTPVRGNFARLQGCLAELRALPVEEGAFRAREHLVAQVVQDGLQQFKQYTRQGMAGATLNSSSVEVTILTGHLGTEVVSQLEAGLQGTDLVSLRQLQVVEIFQGPSEAESTSYGRGGAGRGTGEHPVALGTDVDLQAVENDAVALEMFFKGWFHDHSMDREHLHLLLPAGASGPSAAAPRAEPVCLKCDAQERLLSPALLPAACCEDCREPFWMAASRGPATPRLRVIRALEAGGLCQSLLFGLPLVLRSTNCWQLSWEELEVNQHGFQALCHCLRVRQWLLLARLEPPGARGSPFQVLLPSDSCTLLLLSVAVQELLLPCSLPFLPPEPPKAALSTMESVLDGLEVEPAYNPLSVASHLCRALRNSLGRPPTARPPRQRSGRHPLAKATVAPLHLALPAAPPLFSSEDDELPDPE